MMRSRSFAVAGVAAIALSACGSPPPAATPNGPASIPGLVVDPPGFGSPPAASASSSVTASPPASPSAPASAPALPPPKPVTLPLATRTGDPVDEQLVQGDEAFEQGDLAAASSHYEAARKGAPKRAAPVVGVARVAIARVGAAMDYAAAKGSKPIAAAAKDLKRATQLEASFGPAYVELGRAWL